MKILMISSPHAFATRDVFIGHRAGLQSILGADNVKTYDIVPRYNLFHKWTEWLAGEIGNVPRELRANILAAEPVFAAAHLFEVDVVYFISPMYFPMSIVEMLRKDGFKCWSYFTECPYEDEFWSRAQASKFDYCFVNDVNSLTRFRMYNPNTFYVPHAYNPDVHFTKKAPDNNHEHVTFVGTAFPKRQIMFEAVNWEGIDLRLYGNWQEVPTSSKLTPFIRQRLIDNHTSAQIYRGSTVGLSMHRQERHWDADDCIDEGEAYSLGPRSYELAACGLYQISDWRPELTEVFGDSIRVVNTPEDLEREVRWALEHPEKRVELTQQQTQAVQGHTVQDRMTKLLELVA